MSIMLKRNSSKALSILIAFALVLSLIIGLAIPAGAAVPKSPPTPPTASGTMTTLAATPALGLTSTVWTIGTAAEWSLFSAYVNAGNNTAGVYFYLTGDIYLNANAINPDYVDIDTAGINGYKDPLTGQPIPVNEIVPVGGGASSVSFRGTFDGQGKTIYNAFYNHSDGSYGSGNSVKNNSGLFGKLEYDGTIMYLNTDGGYIGAQRSIGGIVGKSWGTTHDCVNGNYVFGNQSQGLGGVIGANWTTTIGATTYRPTVYNCGNTGTVVSGYTSGSAGGIAGENEGAIYNCWNTGFIGSDYNAGGIVGSNKNNYDNQAGIGGDIFGGVSNSYNEGAISGKFAGGIIGFEQGSCQNVYNNGDVTHTAGGAAGEIIGEMNVTNVSLMNEPWYIAPGTDPIGSHVNGAYGYLELVDLSTADDLLELLNIWVVDNGSPPYEYWIIGASGYPVF